MKKRTIVSLHRISTICMTVSQFSLKFIPLNWEMNKRGDVVTCKFFRSVSAIEFNLSDECAVINAHDVISREQYTYRLVGGWRLPYCTKDVTATTNYYSITRHRCIQTESILNRD